MTMAEYAIRKVTKRYWWPHPIYRQAKAGRWSCLHQWLPCADVVFRLRYFRNGVEVKLDTPARYSGA